MIRESLRARRSAAVVVALSVSLGACAHVKPLPPGEALSSKERKEAISQASVWSHNDIARVDFNVGPKGDGAFGFNEWVNCDYKEKKNQTGRSPKFTCEVSPGREVKVKYGARNAEVFGEVLATRLFWALGFPADLMYPVRVRCRGCPDDPKKGPEREKNVVVFDPAAIERKLPGRPMETRADSGWKWSELENIGPGAPKGARAHRDALKLLAAFVQHTDSKGANQRLLCPKGQEVGKTGCKNPVLMIHDLGLTFGEAGFLIHNKDSVSLTTWGDVPVWKEGPACVAQVSGSFTGSFSNPQIGEAGRAFLSGLLVQLTDPQLHSLFESARVKHRSSDPGGEPDDSAELATVSGWVKAFKLKRAQIVDRRCPW